MSMTIKTNHQFRELIHAWDLTKKELREFDYMANDELNEVDFFRYRGQVYCMNDFVRIEHKGHCVMHSFCHYDITGDLKEWDAIKTDSFFSGVVIKYNKDFDCVKVGLSLS